MRFDMPRVLLAAVAAAFAAVASWAASRDSGMSSNEFATQALGVEAVVAATLALWPSARWSLLRRAIAGGVAIVSAALAPILIAVTSARLACGCGDPSTGYLLSRTFGLSASEWVVLAAIAYPILVAATTVWRHSDRAAAVSLGTE